ncbi:MAG: hypothetical protein LBN27_12125 [Prevotellaceae bacterium]|jgi:hypothetical protein|nr:hypothetical protein [Prevotellaceae bacterium]
MKRLQNILIVSVLAGIIIELGKVFIFLFERLDNGNVVATITGVTFALASVLFVVLLENRTVKITMIMLDVATILYYYLFFRLFEFPIEWVSVVIALYTGMIVYYFGRIVADRIRIDTEADTERLTAENNRLAKKLQSGTERCQKMEDRLRIVNELTNLEAERERYLRRVKESKTESTRTANEKRLNDIENEIYELKKQKQ